MSFHDQTKREVNNMNDNRDVAVQITNLKKYRLGVIGGGTLQGDIQSWWAKKEAKKIPI